MDPITKQQAEALEQCLQLAVAKFEGNVFPRPALARIAGVSREAAYRWKRVPAEHCLTLEEAFDGRITRYQMRPDIFGDPPESAAA